MERFVLGLSDLSGNDVSLCVFEPYIFWRAVDDKEGEHTKDNSSKTKTTAKQQVPTVRYSDVKNILYFQRGIPVQLAHLLYSRRKDVFYGWPVVGTTSPREQAAEAPQQLRPPPRTPAGGVLQESLNGNEDSCIRSTTDRDGPRLEDDDEDEARFIVDPGRQLVDENRIYLRVRAIGEYDSPDLWGVPEYVDPVAMSLVSQKMKNRRNKAASKKNKAWTRSQPGHLRSTKNGLVMNIATATTGGKNKRNNDKNYSEIAGTSGSGTGRTSTTEESHTTKHQQPRKSEEDDHFRYSTTANYHEYDHGRPLTPTNYEYDGPAPFQLIVREVSFDTYPVCYPWPGPASSAHIVLNRSRMQKCLQENEDLTGRRHLERVLGLYDAEENNYRMRSVNFLFHTGVLDDGYFPILLYDRYIVPEILAKNLEEEEEAQEDHAPDANNGNNNGGLSFLSLAQPKVKKEVCLRGVLIDNFTRTHEDIGVHRLMLLLHDSFSLATRHLSKCYKGRQVKSLAFRRFFFTDALRAWLSASSNIERPMRTPWNVWPNRAHLYCTTSMLHVCLHQDLLCRFKDFRQRPQLHAPSSICMPTLWQYSLEEEEGGPPRLGGALGGGATDNTNTEAANSTTTDAALRTEPWQEQVLWGDRNRVRSSSEGDLATTRYSSVENAATHGYWEDGYLFRIWRMSSSGSVAGRQAIVAAFLVSKETPPLMVNYIDRLLGISLFYELCANNAQLATLLLRRRVRIIRDYLRVEDGRSHDNEEEQDYWSDDEDYHHGRGRDLGYNLGADHFLDEGTGAPSGSPRSGSRARQQRATPSDIWMRVLSKRARHIWENTFEDPIPTITTEVVCRSEEEYLIVTSQIGPKVEHAHVEREDDPNTTGATDGHAVLHQEHHAVDSATPSYSNVETFHLLSSAALNRHDKFCKACLGVLKPGPGAQELGLEILRTRPDITDTMLNAKSNEGRTCFSRACDLRMGKLAMALAEHPEFDTAVTPFFEYWRDNKSSVARSGYQIARSKGLHKVCAKIDARNRQRTVDQPTTTLTTNFNSTNQRI
ncbi:unnamed protein product [Amoebophrya sp. A25]|nr:unnamed protein product [Amoebophrya sp. A25]|eukprot:GSA25T00015527001.1